MGDPKLRPLMTASSGLIYDHTADFTGGVRVELPMGQHVGTHHGVRTINATNQTVEVVIPFEDMRHLVLASMRSRMMLHLQEADDDTLEKFFFSGVSALEIEEPEMCGKNATPGFANPPCPLDAGHDGDCTTI